MYYLVFSLILTQQLWLLLQNLQCLWQLDFVCPNRPRPKNKTFGQHSPFPWEDFGLLLRCLWKKRKKNVVKYVFQWILELSMRVLWYYHDFEYFARYSLDPVSSIHILCAFVRTLTKDTAIDSQKNYTVVCNWNETLVVLPSGLKSLKIWGRGRGLNRPP